MKPPFVLFCRPQSQLIFFSGVAGQGVLRLKTTPSTNSFLFALTSTHPGMVHLPTSMWTISLLKLPGISQVTIAQHDTCLYSISFPVILCHKSEHFTLA